MTKFRLSLTIILICIAILYTKLLIQHHPAQSDFISFYSAAQLFRQQPLQLYDPTAQFQAQLQLAPNYTYHPFLNPSFYLLPMIPLTFVPLTTAYHLNLTIQTLILICCLLFLQSHFKSSSNPLRLLIAVTFAPVYTTLFQGHSSIITFAVFLLIYYFFSHRRFFITGFLTSILLYKPQLALIPILFFLFSPNRRKILPGLITGTTILTLTILLLNPNIQSYLSLLSWYTHSHDQLPWFNLSYLSFSGLIAPLSLLIPIIPFNLTSQLLSLSLIIHFLKSHYTAHFSNAHQFSALILTTLLASGHIHHHEGLLLLFPFFAYSQHPSPKFWMFIATGWILFLLGIFSPLAPLPLPFLLPLYIIVTYKLINTHPKLN